MKFIKEFGIFEGSEPPIEVGSKWMNKKGWGDISDLYLTPDDDKKAVFTVTKISDKGSRITYTIEYDGNPNPDKVFTQGRKGFLNDLKPKFRWKDDDNHIIGKRLVKEAYERPMTPGTHTKWTKNGSDEIATVLGAGDWLISYEFNGEKVQSTIKEFMKDFTEIVKPVIVPEKDMYSDRLSGEDDLELDFNKAEYLADEKAIIAAYFITKKGEKSIEILNIKEFAADTATFIDNARPYSVTFHKGTLPTSQIEILKPVSEREGFFYVKVPYWLYKEKPELNIKRIVGDYHYMKRLDLRDVSLNNKELMSNFKDPDVIKYFAASDKDDRTQQQVINYGRRS